MHGDSYNLRTTMRRFQMARWLPRLVGQGSVPGLTFTAAFSALAGDKRSRTPVGCHFTMRSMKRLTCS